MTEEQPQPETPSAPVAVVDAPPKKKRGRKPRTPKPPPPPMTEEEEAEIKLRRIAELRRLIAIAESQHKLQYKYSKTNAEAPGAGGPYEWQLRFHAAAKEVRQRMIQAGNRSGKSYPAGAEAALHATGDYSVCPWWNGIRFDKPTRGWVCGPRNEDLQKAQQKFLLGDIEEGRRPSGTGWLPLSSIGAVTFRQCGIPNVVDEVKVRHVSGDWTTIGFKSFEQGADAFQSVEVDWAWLDEEPVNGDPNGMLLNQILMRMMTTNGHLMFTRTALDGLTSWIQHFRRMEAEGLAKIIKATWDDAEHLSEQMKAAMWTSTPEHLRNTVKTGEPAMGSGGIYDVPDEWITCDAFEIPSHWRCICGIDFGIGHKAAGAWIAWDQAADVIYVYDCYRMSGQTPVYHAEAIKTRGKWIPVSWPHDGIATDKGSGKTLASQYRDRGVNMIGMSARYEDDKGGGQNTETVIGEILERMRTGRFKVFRHLNEWFEEKRSYHRKQTPLGPKIVRENDDTLAATHYAMMMLRCAISLTSAEAPRVAVASDMNFDPVAEFSR